MFGFVLVVLCVCACVCVCVCVCVCERERADFQQYVMIVLHWYLLWLQPERDRDGSGLVHLDHFITLTGM